MYNALKKGDYNELGCKDWKKAFQKPGIDIYKDPAAVWCCSECHYANHAQTTIRRAPVPYGPPNDSKSVWLYLQVCCVVGAKCRK